MQYYLEDHSETFIGSALRKAYKTISAAQQLCEAGGTQNVISEVVLSQIK